MGNCDFHKYSYVKTDAWVYLKYLFESFIWEAVFSQHMRVIGVKMRGLYLKIFVHLPRY